MRVIQRRALSRLLPLPDRLHFTPAMSARALLDEQLTIGEVPISYAERVGRSKLNVVRDGLRFLAIILSTALYVRPSRLTFPLAAVLCLTGLALLAQPALLYLSERRLEEWMIYRLLVATLLATIVVTLLCATLVAEQIIALSRGRHRELAGRPGVWWRWLDGWRLAVCGGALVAIGLALVGPGLVEYLTTSQVTIHWSRVVVASFVGFLIVQIAVAAALTKTIAALAEQQTYWLEGILSAEAEPAPSSSGATRTTNSPNPQEALSLD
jgi:hypothetical protein